MSPLNPFVRVALTGEAGRGTGGSTDLVGSGSFLSTATGVGAATGAEAEVGAGAEAGAGEGALCVGVGIDLTACWRGAALAATFLPSSKLTRIGTPLFPAKKSLALRAGTAEGALRGTRMKK